MKFYNNKYLKLNNKNKKNMINYKINYKFNKLSLILINKMNWSKI